MIGSLVLAAALLVAAAGAAKLVAPGPAAAMLRRAWPRLRRLGALPVVVRAGGVLELAIGGAVVAAGGRITAALLAGCYAAFALVALRLTRPGRQRISCGCFGRADSPVGRPHLVLNLMALAVAVAAVVRPVGAAGDLFADRVVLGLIGVGQAVLLAYLGFLSITALPALAADRRRAAA